MRPSGRFQRLEEGAYRVTEGEYTFRVQRAWYRVGGWQWDTNVPWGRTTVRGPSRHQAVEKALWVLRRNSHLAP